MSVTYRGNGSANNLRLASGAIWGNCPWKPGAGRDATIDCQSGMPFFDDFLVSGNANMTSAYQNSIGQWSVYGYAGGLYADAAAEGGVVKFGSDGDNEGVTLLSSSGAYRLVTTSTLALNGKMWFECRVARSSVTTAKGDFFVGLMTPSLSSNLPAAAQPISTTDDTLATAPSFIGFHSNSSTGTRGGPTEWSFAFNLASGTVNYPTNLTTLMASSGNSVMSDGTFVKLGFLFDPKPNQKKYVSSATARQTAGALVFPLIRIFVNGLELPTFLSADDVVNATAGQAFPTGYMSPVISVMNTTGATPPTMSCDWLACYQNGLT